MTDQSIDPLPGSPAGPQPDVGKLLARMQQGDRDAAAEFIARFGQRIRRRVHGRLRPGVRRLFDSLDIVSTLSRRLDLLVESGKLRATTEPQLWALVLTMAENAAIDSNRRFNRLRTLESARSRARSAQVRADSSGSDAADQSAHLNRAFSALSDQTDREILAFWLQDTPHLVTARLVGLSPAAVRKRWETIKRRLSPLLDRE